MSAETLVTEQKMVIASSHPFSETKQLGQWMYKRIQPFAKGKIMEIGSGCGSISNIFINNDIRITLSDSSTYYCRLLKKKFLNERMVEAVQQLDLTSSAFEEANSSLLESFDMVFALNIVEHSALGSVAIANAKKLLTTRGYLILFQPAHTALYNELELGLNHWHCCNKLSIKKLLGDDFEIIKMRYFNLIGLVKKFLSGPLLDLNNRIVPSFQIEDLAFRQIGLSMIAVAQKTSL